MKSEAGQVNRGGFTITYAGFSDRGLVRGTNEDDFLLLPEKGLFCLTDGVGGEARGELASTLALESIQSLAGGKRAGGIFSGGRERGWSLEQMLRHANTRVYEQRKALRARLATTIVMVRLGDEGMEVAHAGDSRMYRWDGRMLHRCTRDHSLVEQLCRNNLLRDEDRATHPQHHVITRALGARPDIQVQSRQISLRNGDIILLCSDGLTTMLPDREVEQVLLRGRSDVIRTGQALVAAANEAGGRDNITVVLLLVTWRKNGSFRPQ